MEAPTFHKDMDIDIYHGHKDIISKSMLGDFADCPARFKHKYIDGNTKEPTKSLRMGNAVHTLALEPELWKKGYHVMPTHYYDDDGAKKPFRNDKRIKSVQDEYEKAGYTVQQGDNGLEFVERPNCKVILTQKENADVEIMANALAKNNFACSLLKQPGYVEASIFWEIEVENPETGELEIVKLRCRPDHMGNNTILTDLKIAKDVKPDFFYKDACNYHYDLSVALSFMGYEALYGKEPDNYVFVCVEQREPNLVECFESVKPFDDVLGLSYLDYGRAHLNALLSQYVVCRAKNEWPGYQTQIGSMAVPGWAMDKFIKKGF